MASLVAIAASFCPRLTRLPTPTHLLSNSYSLPVLFLYLTLAGFADRIVETPTVVSMASLSNVMQAARSPTTDTAIY